MLRRHATVGPMTVGPVTVGPMTVGPALMTHMRHMLTISSHFMLTTRSLLTVWLMLVWFPSLPIGGGLVSAAGARGGRVCGTEGGLSVAEGGGGRRAVVLVVILEWFEGIVCVRV